jgi:hypothetical protein
MSVAIAVETPNAIAAAARTPWVEHAYQISLSIADYQFSRWRITGA